MKLSKFGFAMAAMACLPMVVSGQCRTVQVVQTVNGQPVVTRSVQCGNSLPVPVAVPTTTYQAQTYAAPTATYQNHQNYEHRVVAVPVAVQPDYVFTVRDDLRDKLLVDAIAGRLAPLLIQQQQNNLLLQQQIQQMGQIQQLRSPVPAVVDQQREILPIQQPRPGQTATGGSRDIPLGYQAKPELTKLFSQRCNQCHGDNGIIKGNIDLRDLTRLTDRDWSDIYQDCDLGTMPKDDKSLTADEYKIVQTAVREARKLAKR